MLTITILTISIVIIFFFLKSIGNANKITEIKVAFVGKYVFDNLSDDQKNKIIKLSNKRLTEGFRGIYKEGEITLENEAPIVRYIFYALAMMETGIEPGVKKFQWMYVRNPLKIRNYDKKLWDKAIEQLKKYHGIEVSFP
jgi:hypothetical protein